jgi:hypothetical protein
MIITLVIRYIERKNLKNTISNHEKTLDDNLIPVKKHRNLFHKLIDKFRSNVSIK